MGNSVTYFDELQTELAKLKVKEAETRLSSWWGTLTSTLVAVTEKRYGN